MVFSSLFKKKNNDTEHYFGIFLQTTKAIGFLYEITNTGITIKGKETVPYTNGWEEIIDNIDSLLSSLEEETKLHADKTIFFLYATCIDEKTHEIKDPYKKSIKQIVKELDLVPLGYIECYEAVREYMEHQSQGPFNGNIVEVDTTHSAAFVFKGGKNVFIRESARTQNIGDDISNIFSHKDNHLLLPSRMILYGAINSEELRNQVRDYTWDESYFVQLPRVEFFEDKELFNALSQTFLKQIKQTDPAGSPPLEDNSPLDEEQNNPPSSSERKEENPPKPDTTTKTAADEEPDSKTVLGFVIGEDITEVQKDKPLIQEKPLISEQKDIPKRDINEDSQKEEQKDKKSPFAFIQNIKKPSVSMPDLSFALPKKLPTGMIIGWVLVIAVIAGVGFIVEYFFHKVTISVALPTEVITEEIPFEAVVGEETSGITIQERSITEDVTASKTATGTKEVGEQATGTVLLHNFEEDPTTIAAGTTISADGLSFTLNDATSVPGATEGRDATGVVKQPGKAEATVTATEIGTEYNIEDDVRMAVGDLSSSLYFALSQGAFTGGSKEDVVIVSQADHTNLEQQIEEKADAVDISQIAEDLPEGRKLIKDLTTKEIGTLDYSRAVGDEASEVSLTATVEITAYTYEEEEMKKALLAKIKPDTPEGYAVGTNTIDYDISSASIQETDQETLDEESTETVIELDVIADAGAVKMMKTDDIQQELTGKFLDDADFILKNRYNIEEYEIENQSSYLVLINRWLPFFENNIEVIVQNTVSNGDEEEE
jgi:hypothetical protein